MQAFLTVSEFGGPVHSKFQLALDVILKPADFIALTIEL